MWLLPIVLVVCALMLSPAGGLLAARSASSATLAASLSAAASTGGTGSMHLPSLLHSSLPSSPAGPAIAPTLLADASGFNGGLSASPSPPLGARSGGSNAPSGVPAVATDVASSTPGWVASVDQSIADGQVPASAAYLPSLSLLNEHVSTPSQAVSPIVTVSPAPMGIADFGLSANGPYSVYTQGVAGGIQLSGYNATAGTTYETTGAYYWDGLSPNAVVTPWQSGVQLNTVLNNVSYPGSDIGAFWTQNVLDFSGSTLQFIDNVWNLSSPGAAMEYGTIYSGNGVLVPGELYYDYGPTLPLSFPLTINLYNNASIIDGRSALTFGYRVVEGATVYTGVYDTVVFNSQPTVVDPLLTPDYLISGFNLAPDNFLLDDAELVFGGPGGGSNAEISSMSGDLSLAFLNGSAWEPAPSAYDYGTDTGETAIGMAATWSGTNESVSQGPSILYGLWNTTYSVPSGQVPFVGHLDPSYGFAFIGLYGTNTTNLSYAPSAANGTVLTWLPPSIVFNLTVFADGFSELNATFEGAVNAEIDLVSSPGTWNAPLYMNGDVQAAALALDTLGESSAPYEFYNLNVSVNQTFNHVNDYYYPTFDLLWAYGLTTPLAVDNISQGGDAPNGDTYYAPDYNGSGENLPYFGDEIAVWSSPSPFFENLFLPGYLLPAGTDGGGAIALWNDSDAFGYNLTSVDDTFGLWASDSPFTAEVDSVAYLGAVALTLMASAYAFTYNLSAFGFAADVLDEGGLYGDLDQLNATGFSDGVVTYGTNDTGIYQLNATEESVAADLEFGSGLYVYAVNASFESVGVEGLGLNLSSVYDVAIGTSEFDPGVVLEESNNSVVQNVYGNSSEGYGVLLLGDGISTVTNVTAVNDSAGVIVEDSYGPVGVDQVVANDSVGVAIGFNAVLATVTDVNATNGSIGVESYESFDVEVREVSASGFAAQSNIGVDVLVSEAVDVSYVSAEGGSIGVDVSSSYDVSIANVTATYGALGVWIDPSAFVYVTGTVVSQEAAGVMAEDSTDLWINDTNVFADSLGVLEEDGSEARISNTSASDFSLGVGVVGSNASWVNSTDVSGLAIGVGIEFSTGIHVDGVTATGSGSPPSPWLYQYVWGVPTSAVVTYETFQSTVSDVVASGYPAALYDNSSSVLGVQSVNASGGDFGIVLNGTTGSVFAGIQAYQDQVGLQMNWAVYFDYEYEEYVYANASDDVVTGSSFVDCVGFGVDITHGVDNTVYLNDFVGDNGATSTYSAAHIQAFSNSASNEFNSSNEVGNYWADWHSYTDGVLNPYYLSNGTWDYHPLGAMEGAFFVTFYASGLASGTSWSVTLGNTTQSSVGSWITFVEYPGTYGFTVGAVPDYEITPAAGSVVVSTGPVAQTIEFAATYHVTVKETGLAASTSWSAFFGGVEKSTSGTSIAFTETAGTYSFQIPGVGDYTPTPANGTVTVTGNYTLWIAFSSPTVYTVWVNETGLSGDVTWSAIFNGVEESTGGTSLAFSVPAGTYSYQIGSVAGYAASPSAGSVGVSGNFLLLVTFSSTTGPTYSVTISESGLPGDTEWSAIFNGIEESTSGTSLVFTVAAGTYNYQIVGIAGYTVSPSGGSVTVGGNYALAVAFSTVKYAVTVSETGLASGTVWSATVNGVTQTSSGTEITFYEPNGTWSFSVASVSGYSLTGGSGSIPVSGSSAGTSVAFTPSSSPSYVGTSTYNTGFDIALALAVVALLVALFALLRRPRAPPPPPAAQWQEPEAGAGEETSSTTGTH